MSFKGNQSCNKKYIVYGGIPKPLGGVTSFIRRLLIRHSARVLHVIDFYPDEKEKIPKHLYEKIVFLPGMLGLVLWFNLNSRKHENKIHFFNFSTARSLIVLLLFWKQKGAEWRLMLHHGTLEFDSVILKYLSRIAIAKIDFVYALSDTQYQFYDELGIKTEIVRAKSYCPYNGDISDHDGKAYVKTLRKDFSKIFITSGYPTALYNYDKILDAFKQPGLEEYLLVIFVYGPGSLRQYIRDRALTQNNVVVLEDKPELFFNTVLGLSDCLLRITNIDSFGVSVADAINMNVAVITTNVTDRYPGAYLIELTELEAVGNVISGYPNSLRNLKRSTGAPSAFEFSLGHS